MKNRLDCIAKEASARRRAAAKVAGQSVVKAAHSSATGRSAATRLATVRPKPRLMPLPKPWADKSANEIMNGLGPLKSADRYNLEWSKFEEFRANPGEEPGEGDYIRYFDFLHEAKEFKASTLWKTYAMLNSMHQRKYGNRLQLWPRLKMLLKRYNQGYERTTASIFSQEQIKQALQLDYSSPKWIMWKAVVATAFCGGLRGIEVRMA